MVLVDTSVWVAHLRLGNIKLETLLNDDGVLSHPFVIGELACGNIKNRSEILSLLEALPVATQAGHNEVMQFIEIHSLMRLGLGYIDMHLLASTLLTNASLWTLDKKLYEVALRMRLAF
ncbi:MAG: PIN domain-containing protein [Candidatus Aquicultor sp.]|nr:PIN domain-containing protein [Candidatus Aquicultor sp.]